MAVYTYIEDEALSQFLSQYDIGRLLSFAGIAEGVENSNYLLRTDQHNYILTLYEKRVNADDLPFFIGLMRFLSESGYPCPVPITDKKGQILQQLAGRPAAMVSFLDGTSQRFPNSKKCRALGKALARFHLDSKGFNITRENALGPQGWQPLLNSVSSLPDDFPPQLLSEASSRLNELLRSWPEYLPTGFIHADLFPNNALFVGDELTGVIDFYFACNDILAYDLAICLNSWCFDSDGSFNVTKSAALIEGYTQERPLEQAEKDALPLLCSGAAMRFFLTRLYDWMNTPADALVKPLNPMEYWQKLRFHHKASSAAAYGLWS